VITLVTHHVSGVAAQAGQKNGRGRRPAELEESNSPYYTSAIANSFTKSDLMKSILSDSAVLAARRCIGFVSVMVLAALPAIGAGSAKQAIRKDSDPSITICNQGVELMLAKRFPEAQAKFEQAVKENPRFAEAHNNLGYSWQKSWKKSLRLVRKRTAFTDCRAS
jgi:hypothetical protein